VIRVERLLNDRQLTEVREAIDRYKREIVPNIPNEDFVLEKDGRSVRNLWRMEQHAPFFKALSERRDILELVGPLVNGDPVCWAVETFNKPALDGSGVPPHQDNAYFCKAPPDMLTVWIAVDPVTAENGPVHYLMGSHSKGMRPHKKSGVKGNSMGLSEPMPQKVHEELCGTLNPGDALLHHCQTIHWSDPNTTEQPRCGLLIVYRGKHAEVDAELENAYQ
jgi:ectoine hydroxylase-related dioxygenase (phytanoyl-CoA dioxygenase family)